MPNDSRNPSWKAAGPKAERKGPKYAWKPQGGSAVPGRGSRRLMQAFFLLGGAACVAGIIFLIKFLQAPPRSGLAIVGADPTAEVEKLDVPLDPYGWQGGKRLADWAISTAEKEQSRWGKLTPQVLDNDVVSLGADGFSEWAEKVAASKANPLVVYFGFHGGADENGPFLFAAGGSRLDLKAVIETFGGPSFKDRSIVLVLDPGRLVADPSIGLLLNDCVRGLQSLESTIQGASSNLVVLCGSGPGQQAWDSEEWRATAFTQMMLEGLRGAAAPSGQTLISAWDLFEYVQRRTADWANANRPTPQKPILLPSPDSGGRERAAAITVAVKPESAVPMESTDPPGANFQAPDELIARWTECQKLANATPSPAAYSPRSWRRYRQLLLRYEQMVRAGEQAAAGRLSQVLIDAERELEGARTIGRSALSRSNALPLSAAFGGADAARWTPEQEATFRELWDVRTIEAERTKQLEAIRSAGISMALTSYLLRRAADVTRPPDEFWAALGLLSAESAADPGSPSPAEAHFAIMLQKFSRAGEKPPVELLRLAIGTRLLAEQAALVSPERNSFPYSERIWPAIRATIIDADAQRRPGEDLLFTSSAHWPDAKTRLTTATRNYTEALQLGRQLQTAYAVRDRAFADLPYLSAWLGESRPEAAKLQNVVDLWAKLHELDRQLHSPKDATTLAAAINAVQSPFEDLAEKYERAGQDAREFSVLQRNWRQIENLLRAPLLEPKLRQQLLNLSRSMSARLNSEQAQPKDAASADVEEPLRTAAERRGQLGVAELFDPNDKASANLRTLVANFPATGWESSAMRAGDQMAAAWKNLLAANEDADKAERASRLAIAFSPMPPPEPATVNRLRRWQSLLADLARRTATDRWSSEAGEHYFRLAGRRYLNDAKSLVERPIADLDAIEKLIDAPSLKLEGPNTLNWTSERERELAYSIVAPPPAPSGGFVSIWPTLGSGPLKINPDELPRQPLDAAGAKKVVHLNAPIGAVDATIPLTVYGYFRGAPLEQKTEVQLDRTPITIYQKFLPPDNAGIAVRAADDLRLGAIAIVLDFSGSMKEVQGREPNVNDPNSKFRQALRVLKQSLSALPKGTPLSIRIFGHTDSVTPVPANLPYEQRLVLATRGMRSERMFKGPVAWSPENPEPLKNLMELLGNQKPEYGTPLIHSMIEAKNNDFPEGFSGPRTLLVLSDGADTSYLRSERVPKVRQEFENAFSGSGVTVHIVGFRINPTEEQDARSQFEPVSRFRPPGRIWKSDNPERLAENLDLALRPKVQLLVNGKPAAGLPPTGLPANRFRDELEKLRLAGPLRPQRYEALVHKDSQQMLLNRGDRLLVRLTRDADGVRFQRDLFANELSNDRRKSADNWVLGVPQVLDDPTAQMGRLRLMATLETTSGQLPGRDGVLQQTPPGFVLWEVAANNAANPKLGQLRAVSLPGYPAPAWDITVHDWPVEPTPVKLTAWVGSDPPAGRRIAIPAEKVLAGPFEQAVEIDGQTVVVSIAHEMQPLVTDKGERVEPCLVVRTGFQPNHPVMARFADLNFNGEEHRFYKAAAYTGLFGPITRDQLSGLTLELDLLSVTKMREGATKITIDLPKPRPGEQRPQTLKFMPETDNK
jgi:flagellar motor protein MotB